MEVISLKRYKIETHLHTTYVSRCGWMGAEAIIKLYTAAGYDAICITDHYNRTAFKYCDVDLDAPGSKVREFLRGCERVQNYAKEINSPLKVIPAAEVRFDGSENDYLLYGFHEELLADPLHVFTEGLAAFYKEVKQDGAILIQAHPYRKSCQVMPAEYLDGMEVYNACVRHNSHNDMAFAYATEHNLLMTAGSDAHRQEDVGLAGITSEHLPETTFDMAKLIRSKEYELLIQDEEQH